MRINNKFSASLPILFLLFSIAFWGCSGGGSSDVPAPSPTPSLQVLPSEYDFGIITQGNSPIPLEVKIKNGGAAGLNLSDISLKDPNFDLNLGGGSNPCNTTSLTLPAGDDCTVVVDFTPLSTGSYDGNLTINSNDLANRIYYLPLSGHFQEISELNVRINQLEPCPRPLVTAYVSVTDQGGFPVTVLTKNDFLITETGGYGGAPTSVSFVSNNASLSVALVMDYSQSISKIQDNLDDMQDSAAMFVDQMETDDEAEIIKFATEFDVVQPFTSGSVAGKELLKAAIYAPYDNGTTDLYDAVYQAVVDTAARSKTRKAVIVITDGENYSETGPSDYDLTDIINYANTQGVPVFTVGLGQANEAILTQMADDTGGQFFKATTSDNLKTIYQQLADVFFHDQYILTYTSFLGPGDGADLTIKATLNTLEGENTRGISSCP